MEHYNPGEPYYDPRNPNLGGPYDRSSKRLRVDDPFEDAERRSRLVRDHGAPNSNFDFGLRPPFTRETNIMHHQQDGSMKTGMGTGMPFPIVEHSTLANATKFQNHDQHLALYAQLPKPPHPTTFSGGLGHDYNTHSNVYHHLNYGHSHGSTASFYGGNMPSNNGLVHHDHRSNMPTLSNYSSSHRYNYASPPHFTDVRQPIQTRPPPFGSYHNIPMGSHYAHPPIDFQRGYCTSMSENMGYSHASQGLDVQPPLPSSPPPPLPIEPSIQWSAQHKCLSSPSTVASSLFPVPFTTSAPMPSLHPPISEPNTPVAPLLEDSQPGHTAHGMFRGDYQGTLTSLGQYHGDGQPFPSKHNFPDKHSIIDAVHLFKPPHRTSRPDHFVIILRGLPGSGKSYLAKMLRDLEVKHGGNAPRIHSMDDYFMTEIEKIEENEASKSSARGKKPTMKKVLEYCYEPEMEEAYRSSMLKAFKKTLEEGAFTFVIVDDRNLRVADFAQFWATAKRSGYEVYVLEAPYKDPAGCTARNVHGFTQVDVEKMAAQWEDAPSLYSQVDVKSLLQGDELKESNIQEVDMDTEDGDVDGILIKSEERGVEKVVTSAVLQKDERNWDAEFGISAEEVKDLGRSKWSDNLDDADDERTEVSKRKANVLSGLVKTYGREGKFVHWADQGKHTGFSIGAVKKANLLSLVIGPGAGYNLKSNPLSEEEAKIVKLRETTKRSTFQERLRAEQESFRVVFDRKRQRIGGLDVQD